MKILVEFKLDDNWSEEYKDVNPELIVEDMDLIHKDGITISSIKVLD